MKSFQEIFPTLKHSKNHAVYLLEEAFNRYYEKLETQEEKNKLILDFKTLIGKSEIESLSFCAPLKIEKNKLYFVSDIFSDGDYVDEVHKVLGGEIYRGGIGVLDDAAIVAFNEDAVCVSDSDDEDDFGDVSVTDDSPAALDSKVISNFVFDSEEDGNVDTNGHQEAKRESSSQDGGDSIFSLFDDNLQYSETKDSEEAPAENPSSVFEGIASSTKGKEVEHGIKQNEDSKENLDERLMQIANNYSHSKDTVESGSDSDDYYGDYGEEIEAMRNGEDIGNGLVVYKRQYKEEDYARDGSN